MAGKRKPETSSREEPAAKKQKTYQNIHDAINAGDLNGVLDCINEEPRERHFYNEQNESAAATAIKKKQFNIYDQLLSKKVNLGLREDIKELVKHLTENDKKQIRLIHNKHGIESDSNHLKIIFLYSKLHHIIKDKTLQRKYFKKIEEAYEDLNEIIEIEPILKVVACAPEFNIYFDFTRDSVEHMDPTEDENTKGLCYPTLGDLYIGAKGLISGKTEEPLRNAKDSAKDEETRQEALGVMAHEFCHYAMNLTYNNECKPFCKDDTEKGKTFGEILKISEEKKNQEKYIEYVFNNPEFQRVAELIVRVPHILALYKNRKQESQ